LPPSKKQKNSQLPASFFQDDPISVAQALLGKIIFSDLSGELRAGYIVETEAYLSKDDAGCHASKGKTERNSIMFEPGGFLYIYLIYGLHHCLNIVTEREGQPSAVLIRAIEPITEGDQGIAAGPGKLTKWLGVTKAQNNRNVGQCGLTITSELEINGQKHQSRKILKKHIVASPRIGIDFAGEDAKLPLRFYLKGNSSVSNSRAN
jgi:DNA-3-methyladenine glycosylase